MRFEAKPMCIFALFLSGCATIPNVATNYFLPRTDLTLRVTRTVGCAKRTEGTGRTARTFQTLYSTAELEPTVAYSADPTAGRTLNLAALNGPLSDSEITLEFYDDGRLKSVNSSNTGRGTEVVQAVANLIPLFAASSNAVGAPAVSDAQRRAAAACNAITAVAGEGKTVTLIYEYVEDFAPRPSGSGATDPPPRNCRARGDSAVEGTQVCEIARTRLIPLSARGTRLEEVDAALPPVCVYFAPPQQMGQAADWHGSSTNDAALHVRRAARFDARVYEAQTPPASVHSDSLCAGAGEGLRSTIATGRFLVPLTREASLIALGNEGEFALPVPRGAPFGNNSLNLALAESGAVTKLGYGSVSGTAGALGAIGTIGGALIDTDAERAARDQARSDRIVQQQRRIRCQQNPSTCT